MAARKRKQSSAARKNRAQQAVQRQLYGPRWPGFYCHICDEHMATVRGFQGDTPVAWCRGCLPADWRDHTVPITELRRPNTDGTG